MEGKSWRKRYPVKIVADRINTGAVLVTCMFQGFERPKVAGRDRKGSCAIALYGNPSRVLENGLRFGHVVQELGAGLAVGPMMRKAVRRKLVPTRDDPAHGRGVAFRNPAQRKERSLSASLGEKLEYAIYIAFDTALLPVPTASVDQPEECFNLKIVLDVDRKSIGTCVPHCNRAFRPIGDILGTLSLCSHEITLTECQLELGWPKRRKS